MATAMLASAPAPRRRSFPERSGTASAKAVPQRMRQRDVFAFMTGE